MPPRMSVSMVSPIMMVWVASSPSSLRAARMMSGLGLPTENARHPVAASIMATTAPHPGAVRRA